MTVSGQTYQHKFGFYCDRAMGVMQDFQPLDLVSVKELCKYRTQLGLFCLNARIVISSYAVINIHDKASPVSQQPAVDHQCCA